jgi:hypothetical protein
MTKDFLEEYPLFKKYTFKGPLAGDCRNWRVDPITMHCPECSSIQTFKMTNDLENQHAVYLTNLRDRTADLQFTCQGCLSFLRRFLVYIGQDLTTVYKVGQYPPWEITIDKKIEKALGKHAGNFRKGLVCESQEYGIGAFSYYRRITEDIIDELLDSVAGLIEGPEKEKYLAALEKTKATRVTQEKINLVKDLLPTILRPDGHNPLGVLHSELSGGLHDATDESCLENAHRVRTRLVFLIDVIIRNNEAAKSFSQSMKSLLDKKSRN